MTTLEDHAAFVTKAQQACRKAKDSRSASDLEAARLILDSDDLAALPLKAREDLRWAYAEALMSATGGLAL